MSGAAPALELRGVSKRYGSVVALADLTLEVRAREVVGLLGENGAGKSTLLKILVGLVQPDEGTLRRDGDEVRFASVSDAGRAAIGMVHQEQSLVPNLTVAENILFGNEGEGVRFGWIRWKRLHELARIQLDKIGSSIPVDARTDRLTFSQRQMVEIAKVLAIEERCRAEPVVLLDEPTSVLDGDEVAVLFDQIERLRERASVVLVSHRIEEVLEMADRIYVLRNGTVAAERARGESDVAELQRLMIGRDDLGGHYHEGAQVDRAEERCLELDGLTRHGAYRDVSLSVRKGEVVGLAGVQDSGREALCRTVFGALPFDHGDMRLEGRPMRVGSPLAAVRLGIGYLPAERRTEGMVGTMSVAENMSMADVGTLCTGPFLNRGRERELVDSWIERLRIRTPSRSVPIGRLSGGNQQKVVLARWLMSGAPRLLILDHPTRGLDVGAKAEVYALVRELAARGVAIVLLADSLEETIALSNRVVAMRDGAVTAVIDAPRGRKPEPVDIMEHMT